MSSFKVQGVMLLAVCLLGTATAQWLQDQDGPAAVVDRSIARARTLKTTAPSYLFRDSEQEFTGDFIYLEPFEYALAYGGYGIGYYGYYGYFSPEGAFADDLEVLLPELAPATPLPSPEAAPQFTSPAATPEATPASPPPAPKPSPAPTTLPALPAGKLAIVYEATFQGDISIITMTAENLEAFKTAFTSRTASYLQVAAGDVEVISVVSGSVIVTARVFKPATASDAELAAVREALSDPAYLEQLQLGSFGLSSPAVTVVATQKPDTPPSVTAQNTPAAMLPGAPGGGAAGVARMGGALTALMALLGSLLLAQMLH